MVYHLCALAVIIFVAFLGVQRKSALYSPLFINIFSWLVVFVSGLFFYQDFYPITDNVFIAWLCWFSITSFFFFILQPKGFSQVALTFSNPSSLPVRYYFFIGVMILWLIYRIWAVGNAGSAHFFLNLRMAAIGIEGVETLGLAARFYPLMIALYIFEQHNYKPERKAERLFLLVWLLVYAIGTMGKFAILAPILIWIVTASMQNRVNKLQILKVAGVTFLLMLLAHITRSSEGSDFNLFKMLAVYTYSPIVALGYLDIQGAQSFGQYSLRFFYAVGHVFDLTPEPVSIIMEYVSIPVETNAYTVLMPFYIDFGLFGVCVFAIIYGLLFGMLYSLVNQRVKIYFAVYVSMTLILLSQFMGESLFSTMSAHLQTVFLLLIIYSLAKRNN